MYVVVFDALLLKNRQPKKGLSHDERKMCDSPLLFMVILVNPLAYMVISVNPLAYMVISVNPLAYMVVFVNGPVPFL